MIFLMSCIMPGSFCTPCTFCKAPRPSPRCPSLRQLNNELQRIINKRLGADDTDIAVALEGEMPCVAGDDEIRIRFHGAFQELIVGGVVRYFGYSVFWLHPDGGFLQRRQKGDRLVFDLLKPGPMQDRPGFLK